jgi:hypothetical protein
MPQGLALGDASVEVIAAYYTPPTEIPTTVPAPIVLGEFFLPLSSEVVLEASAQVSNAAVSLELFIYDTVAGAIAGSVIGTSALALTRLRSGLVQLTAGRRYQFMAQAGGGPAADLFGFVEYATLSD